MAKVFIKYKKTGQIILDKEYRYIDSKKFRWFGKDQFFKHFKKLATRMSRRKGKNHVKEKETETKD